MKKMKFILTASLVIVAVASTLAFKAYSSRDLLQCNTTLDQCVVQPPTTNYSDQNNGVIVAHPIFTPFTGIVGQKCVLPTDPCKTYTGIVYNNQ